MSMYWGGCGGGSPFGIGPVLGGGWGWLWTGRSGGRGSADRAFADVAESEDAEQRYFDFAGTTEKLEQDGHSFAGGHDAGHGTGDASERAIADFDLIAGEAERRFGRKVSWGVVVGGPDGLDPALKASADETLRLSDLTLPHAMVRVLLIEQLYRAWSINANHPYHRE